jgi:adenylate kinase
VVLLGPPGVGKGTQAAFLTQQLGVCHLSTGDVFRAARSQRDKPPSPAMAAALDYMSKGHLVPDEIVWEMVCERVGCLRCNGGFVLDGFPRTLAQVSILDGVLSKLGMGLDKVLKLVVPENEIVRRLSGRRTCPQCGAVFHLESRQPAAPGVCDVCGSALVQRPDDREQVIRERMKVYADQTLPVADAYRSRGVLVEIGGFGGVDTVRDRLRSGLGKGQA